mmetsp:Transcript_11048/g.36275  ORF Transcript_11048/g.36275 Transcript_11048/m.36275 type:complete len:208 (+) Transcript_11048:700-1323(+)
MRYAEKSTVASWRAVAASRWPLTACASATFSPRKRVSAPAEWLGSSKKPISCLTSERMLTARKLRVRCSPVMPKRPSSQVTTGTKAKPMATYAMAQKMTSSWMRPGSVRKRETESFVKAKPSAGTAQPSSIEKKEPMARRRPSPRFCSRETRQKTHSFSSCLPTDSSGAPALPLHWKCCPGGRGECGSSAVSPAPAVVRLVDETREG